jgi:phosphate transport system protein
MSKHLERDLEALESRLLAQASMAEAMIQKASRALIETRSELVAEVIELEQQVDREEVAIEESCLKILALHQPVAVDLRRTATVMKINNDLERIADLAMNIAERAQSLFVDAGLVVPDAFDRMVQVAVAMVRASLDAFVNLDTETARAVCLRDDEVDELNRIVIKELLAVMRAQPQLIEAALHLFSASRYIERIGDHATNIAVDVLYLVDGEITRHQHDLDQLVFPS